MADVDMAEASDPHPRVEEVVGEITGGQVELVNLDGCNLTTAGLESVLSALKNDDCSANLMAITLANNQLTDDACSLLLGALRSPTFCPSLLTINLQDNPRLTDQGFAALHEIVSLRTDLQITYKDKEIGAPDDVGLETFKKGAVLQEEEQKHAEPHAQWEALTNCIRSGASISSTAAVMREICDAVDHEVSKEEAIDPVEIQAQGGVTVTRQIQLPPGPYCKYAAEGQLPVLAEIFRLQPLPVQTAAQRRPVAGVGSHRFHASALVCLLVRCACDPRHHSPDTPVLLDAVVNSSLLPRVAHLAFASPSCSCLHTAFLDALSIHTLPQMPAAVWQPLLLENFGLPPETDGVVLDPLPDLLFSHASTALRTDIGRRSGLVGMVIQLARDLHLACEDNTELREALEGQKGWRDLLLPNGPLSKLLSQQQGSLAGGKPNTSSLQGMVEDEIPANQMHLRALFGVREYSQMHQSLSLGIPLQQ